MEAGAAGARGECGGLPRDLGKVQTVIHDVAWGQTNLNEIPYFWPWYPCQPNHHKGTQNRKTGQLKVKTRPSTYGMRIVGIIDSSPKMLLLCCNG